MEGAAPGFCASGPVEEEEEMVVVAEVEVGRRMGFGRRGRVY